MVTDSQDVRAADHAENDVSDSQLIEAAEHQEEMDCGMDNLLSQALDGEIERQSMYGGGAPEPIAQAPPVLPPPPALQAQQAPPPQQPLQQAALNNTARRVIFYPINQLDILQSMNELQFRVTDMLHHEMEQHQGIKWYMALTAE